MVKSAEPTTEKPKRNTGLNADVKLSADLAAIVGSNKMPRTQVVKKMWEVIKSRGLQDPKDKRFIRIIDDDFKKVFPDVDRVQAFGLLKYLKEHMTKA